MEKIQYMLEKLNGKFFDNTTECNYRVNFPGPFNSNGPETGIKLYPPIMKIGIRQVYSVSNVANPMAESLWYLNVRQVQWKQIVMI